MLFNSIINLRSKPVSQLLVSAFLLIPVNMAHAQPMAEHLKIRKKIENAFEWKGQVTAFERSENSNSCNQTIALFAPVTEGIVRYDFVIKDEKTEIITPMIACIRFFEKGSSSFEYFPASVFEEVDQQS